MQKKWIVGLLAISMIAAMGGCSGTESSSSKAEKSSSAETSVVDESNREEASAEESEEESNAEETVDSEFNSEEESNAEETVDSEFNVELLSTSISQDYEGKPVLVVEYNFTNNSDESASFMFSCQDKAFQNGIEFDNTVFGCDEIDSQQQLNEIQPGTTYALKIGYHLQDTTSPVDIEVTSLDFIDEETLLKQTIELS